MAIEARKVSVSYGQRRILDELDCVFQEHQITVILGANGSGKSTLLRSIVNNNLKLEGNIIIDDVKKVDYSRKQLARKISYLSQMNTTVDNINVETVIKQGLFLEMNVFGALDKQNLQKVDEIINFAGLTSKRQEKINNLSGGELQRVWIALTLVQDSNYIILDEPTNHLDVKYSVEILELIKKYKQKLGKTVILVLHDINLASRIADQIILIKDGQVVASGNTEHVLCKDNIDYAYDVNSYITKCPVYDCPQVIII